MARVLHIEDDPKSRRLVQKLLESGLTTIGSVLALGLEGLTAIPSIGPKTAEKILVTLREVLDAPLPEDQDETETVGEANEETASQAEATPAGDESEKAEEVARSAEEE